MNQDKRQKEKDKREKRWVVRVYRFEFTVDKVRGSKFNVGLF
jgi:hypothetical protein